MHVFSRKAFKEAAKRDKALERPLSDWYKVATNAEWQSLADLRKVYPSADYVAPYTIFNIKGNSYRLIVKIEYKWRMVFIKYVLTHEEYEKGGWKK